MKRVYWSIGGGSVMLGLWFLVSQPSKQKISDPVRTENASSRRQEPASAAAKTQERSEMLPAIPLQERMQPQVNELYASTAPNAIEPTGETPEDLPVNEQVTLLRKPVIDAIRLLDVSKGEKYERMREALRDSGESVEAWTRQAPDVFAGWNQLLEGNGNAELDVRSVRCYLAGCEAQVYFESEAEYAAAAKAFRTLSESDAAHGGRVQTPPKRLEDGRWVAAWLMMRPNVAVE